MIGQNIGKYRLELLLGEGGMGSVYRARDVSLQRLVAIKVMHAHLARQALFQQRFLQEAQAAARLDHSGIVRIYDFGQSDDLLYMVMEFVGGGSLGSYLRQLHHVGKVIQLQEVLYLLAQVSEALGYAHARGVLHRDVKPDNILLKKVERAERNGEPPLRTVVTDFGLAKLLAGGLRTTTNTFMGTLPYMSPEQALSQDVDGRSDLYSLGVILYETATGRLPFAIQTPVDAVQKHLNELPPRPQEIKPDLPTEVAEVIERALEKDPNGRFQTGDEMATALREVAAGLTSMEVTQFASPEIVVSLLTEIQAAPETTPPSPWRFGEGEISVSEGPELLIARKGASLERYPLEKETLLLGRDPQSDIVLAEKGVSRRHVRLEKVSDGWQVVDLGSTNGTFLDNVRLLADVPEVWRPGQVLRIGPCSLGWQRGNEDAATRAALFTGLTAVGATQLQGSRGPVGVVVTPAQLSLTPGASRDLQVVLLNQGLIVDHFRVAIEGLPAEWVTMPQERVQLLPGASRTLSISVHPPRDSSARAGETNYRLLVQTVSNPEIQASVTGTLDIQPFEQAEVDVSPLRLHPKESFQVRIRNKGNAENLFAISFRDPAGKILFQGGEQEVRIPAGQMKLLPVQINTRQRRPLFGQETTLNFNVDVTSLSGSVQEQKSGQLVTAPLLPIWLIPAAGLLLIMCCVAGTFTYSQVVVPITQTAQAESVRQTAVAQETRSTRQTPVVDATHTPTLTPPETTVAEVNSATPSPIPASLPPPTASDTPTSIPASSPTASNTPTETPTATDTPTETPTVFIPVILPSPTPYFVTHIARLDTIANNSTFLDDDRINGHQKAILIVTQNWSPPGTVGAYNPHEIGVWYDTSKEQWGILNEDEAPMPKGAAFNVLVAESSQAFIHTALPWAGYRWLTRLDDPLVNGQPDVRPLITQNWNSASGIYNSSPAAVFSLLEDDRIFWGIVNGDGTEIPTGASFNVTVPKEAHIFEHRVTSDNVSSNYSLIDHPLTNNRPEAILFVTHTWGNFTTEYGTGVRDTNPHPIGVFYVDVGGGIGQWAIFNEDHAEMPQNASFYVYVANP